MFFEFIPAYVNENGVVTFDTDSFSTFLFTVDFYGDNGIGFSLLGRSSIMLSELLEILDYDISQEQIADVSFTDPTLLSVEKQEGGDWLLTSLQPFDSEQYLNIRLANGGLLSIFVLDDQPAGTLGVTRPDITTDKVGTAIEGKPGEYEVELKVKGREGEDGKKPLGVILVMDITSSMGSGGIKQLKQGAQYFVDTLIKPADSQIGIAMVQFGDFPRYPDETKILNNGNFFTHDTYNDAINTVNGIKMVSGGATNLQFAMMLTEEVVETGKRTYENVVVVVLMTDGEPNRSMQLAADGIGTEDNPYTVHYKYYQHKSNPYQEIGNYNDNNTYCYNRYTYIKPGKTAEVKALLRKHGADKLSDIKPEEYATLVEEAEGL